MIDTNAIRTMQYSLAMALDEATDNGQKQLAPGEYARGNYLHWLWQLKFAAAKNVAHVVDKMLHCTGGSGFKREPLQLERYLRDGKAGWVMGPTNEVLRQFVGKTALLGIESLDYWNQVVNWRSITNETKKLSAAEKREFAAQAAGRSAARSASAASRRWSGPDADASSRAARRATSAASAAHRAVARPRQPRRAGRPRRSPARSRKRRSSTPSSRAARRTRRIEGQRNSPTTCSSATLPKPAAARERLDVRRIGESRTARASRPRRSDRVRRRPGSRRRATNRRAAGDRLRAQAAGARQSSSCTIGVSPIAASAAGRRP